MKALVGLADLYVLIPNEEVRRAFLRTADHRRNACHLATSNQAQGAAFGAG